MNQTEVIEFLKINGPSTPAKVAKQLGTSLLLSSAILGEIASKGVILMSNLKIGGGSPLYYLRDQEEMLQNFSDALNSKDKQAYQILLEQRVLRDKALTPILRISLRQIKDFAIPLKITSGGESEIFWKWYLLDNREAEEKIKQILGVNDSKVPAKEKSAPASSEIKKPTEERNVIKERPETQTKIHEQGIDLNTDFFMKSGNSFSKKLKTYFEEKSIVIRWYDIIKKNREFVFTSEVPSSIGSSRYYVRAIDKKKVNEGDLAITIVEAQHRNLPALLVSNGDISKKVEEKMSTIFKDITFVKI